VTRRRLSPVLALAIALALVIVIVVVPPWERGRPARPLTPRQSVDLDRIVPARLIPTRPRQIRRHQGPIAHAKPQRSENAEGSGSRNRTFQDVSDD
jgi:hypothetical protein